ncbi:hypothetical protein [Lichenibacterium dinghuense]|uniref:hypothetical protein n=1 Tax=Lichenibacterium dinghuense TaxID=2895977 RepID=UPI001F37D84B|nr:hypothetical protein [Lichenibacterium sp. 6Y81]
MTATDGPDRPPKGRRSTAGAAAVAVTLGGWLAVAAFRPFTPAVPQPGLDASWVAVMGEAAARGLRWGPDLAFTYGPAASLVTGYFNGTYLTLTLPILLATCLLFGACTALAVPPGRRVGAALAVGLIAALSTGYPDSFFLVLPLAPALLRLSGAGAGPAAVAGAAAFAVGAVGMAKMSFPLAALPLFLLADAAALLRRRAPVLAAACALGFLAADLLYGQRLSDLPLFLQGQGQVIAGYSEAMAIDGRRGEVAAFALAAVALVGLAAASERARGRHGSRIALPLGLAWLLLILFKAGFVRQDTHTLIAWFGLALAAALAAPARFRSRAAAAVPAAAAAGAALLGLALVGPAAAPAGSRAAAERVLVAGPAAQLAAAAELARDPAGFAQARRAATAARWRQLADLAPLPPLPGGVDVIPSRQGRVLAAGLDYRPRPSFQEYSTYTPALVAMNRTFLEGPRAPAWVLFGPEGAGGGLSVDGRYPNLAEGGLWLDLLRLYRPERRLGDLLALHRRAVPAPFAVGAPERSEVGFDEEVPVAPLGGGVRAVLAAVDVRPTLLGRLAAFLFKPPALTMAVRFADGHAASYRFVSGIGAAGFVLSPLVDDAADFDALADGVAPPPDRTVAGFSLHVPPRLRALLSPRISVELRDVTGGDAPASTAPTSAWQAVADAQALPPGAPDLGTAPPSRLAVPVAGLSRLDLGFGLALAEDAPPGAGRLCFAVRPAAGEAPLWRRCLDRAAAADRAPQSMSVALPPGTAELVLETTCEAGCEEGVGGYWAPPP